MASNDLESLDKIFDGKYLRIPDYQRGYAWNEHQLKDFWEDLENLENEHIHYTGVLTLEKVTKEKKEENIELWKKDIGAYESDNSYYIVDGQQRITTSIILIKVILESVKKEEWFADTEYNDLYKKYIGKKNRNGIHLYYFGYTADNPSYEFLKTKIFGDKSATNDDKETLYTANLEKAKNFFEEKITNLNTKEKEKLFVKLTKKFMFNVYEISQDLDVFIAFETMNNRGKKLSNLELLKNRLIYLSTKFEDEDKYSLRHNINECWKTVYEYLGKNKDKPLDDDDFLKNHWIMYYEYSRKKGDDYIVDLLEERYIQKRITDKNTNPLTIQEIRDYILSLKNSVKHWYYLFNPNEAKYDDKIKFLLDKLYRLNYGSFAPLLMAIFSKDDKYDTDEVCELLNLMEKYIFLIFKISQRRANTGDSAFYGYARAYYRGEKTIEDIIGYSDFENDKHDGINWWLVSYVDLEQFYLYLKEKFEKREGYFSWNGLSYFLFEYELYLKSKSKNDTLKINWEEYTSSKNDHTSIEHILPQTSNNECWTKELNKINEDKKKYIIHSLGNLVPLSKPKNSKLYNYCFDIKKNGKEGECVGYKNGSYSEQKINEKEKWGIKEIKERTNELIDFLIEHWEIENFIDIKKDMKNKLSFLENINDS